VSLYDELSSRLTNDGNAILREIDVAHPAAKNMIELSRTQDEECGDGTTSVIILGESIAICSWDFTLMQNQSWRDPRSITITA
jgi:T-complex protein 1 subunit gamma